METSDEIKCAPLSMVDYNNYYAGQLSGGN